MVTAELQIRKSSNGVTVDSSGAVYVADTNNNRIQKWAVGATEGVTVAGGNGYGSDEIRLAHPYGVTVDSSGAVYVADTGSNRIQIFTPASWELHGTPTAADVGLHDVALTLTDGIIDVDHEFQITVMGISDQDGDGIPDGSDPWPDDARFSADSDGIPDRWEMFQFQGLGVATATSDTDSDGYSDLDEFTTFHTAFDPPPCCRVYTKRGEATYLSDAGDSRDE